MKSIISDMAAEDLASIWDYVARDDPAAADRLIDRFFSGFEFLATNPKAGERREELGKGIRQSILGRYLILYRLREGTQALDIVAIVHGSRDVPREFRTRYPSR